LLKRAEANLISVWILPVIAVSLIAVWQWATVSANYGGNWTALFCTGALQPHPPLVEQEHVYVFANSAGYDSQAYHYIAHDPFLRSDLKSYIDDPRLRYRRILVPLLAYGIAMGRSQWIDPAYELVCLLSIGLGVYWSCRLAREAGLRAGWGLLFLLMPAIPIAMDRLVVDVGLAALTAAFVYYSRTASWKLFPVLACAALTRETGILLILAYCAYLLWRREFRMAGIFLMSAMPAIVWYTYVQSRTEGKPYGMSLIPLSAILRVLKTPWQYPPGTPLVAAVHAADYLALAGVLLAFGLALYWFLRGPVDPPRIAAALFALMGLMIQRTDHWQNVYDFGRVYTPLLLCLAAVAAQYRKPWLLAPVGMILPRVAVQLTPQFLGVLRWIA
jgi:hypothetical protein